MWNSDTQYFVERWNKLWQEKENKELVKNQVKTLLGSEEFVMFFKKGGSIYACGEESRLVFARIKNPDEDSDEWLKDANFLAVNLTKGLKENKVQNIFSDKDIKSIKVISEEEAEKILISQAKGKVVDAEVEEKDSDEPSGTIQLKDKDAV
jgi:hypothetical protein